MLPSFMCMAPVMYPPLLSPYSFNSGVYSKANPNYLPSTLNSHVVKHMEASREEDKMESKAPDAGQGRKEQPKVFEDE